jgi:hypothetical protein
MCVPLRWEVGYLVEGEWKSNSTWFLYHCVRYSKVSLICWFLLTSFSHSACRVHSVENEADLKLQNAIAVLATVYPQVWLHVALLLPRHVFEPFFVCFARSLMPFLPQVDLQLLVALLPLCEYHNLSLIFCESLFGLTKANRLH